MEHNQIFNFLVNRATDEMTKYLTEDYGLTILQALNIIYNSNIYQKLKDENTGLYEQSPAYVYEYLCQEYNQKASFSKATVR